MSLLQPAIERAVRRIKRDPAYHIASGYSAGELAMVLWYRSRQVLRGIPLRILAPRVRGLVFRGRRVVVEHGRHLAAGPGLILEDDVHINALSSNGIALGRNVTLGRGTQLVGTGVVARKGVGIVVGDRSAIGAGSFLGGQGGITIGADVIMGPGVRIFSENHKFDALDVAIRSQGETRRGVVIGDDCWIGAGATIVDGVHIAPGCVVAAGAVVTHDMPARAVIAGVPARVVRMRGAFLPGERARPEAP